jgi:two-component system LytT family response regulator
MQSKIKAILIDDELHCIKTLSYEIEQRCPQVEVLATFNDSEKGLEGVLELKPELLFLDVEMPKLNGFELLSKLKVKTEQIPFVVFTTAYDNFAIEAFKVDAVDYLMKPILGEDLKRVVEKVSARMQEESSEHVTSLLEDIRDTLERSQTRVALPTGEGIEYVPVATIVYCQSQGSYTRVVRDDKNDLLISRNLKYISDLLPESEFLRVHNSYLVSTSRISKFVRQDGGYLVMDNGDNVGVSRSRRELFTK